MTMAFEIRIKRRREDILKNVVLMITWAEAEIKLRQQLAAMGLNGMFQRGMVMIIDHRKKVFIDQLLNIDKTRNAYE